MLTAAGLAQKIVRTEAKTKVWKEEFIDSKWIVKLLYKAWILLQLQLLQALPHTVCLFISDLSGEKKRIRKKTQTTSELMTTSGQNDFQVF